MVEEIEKKFENEVVHIPEIDEIADYLKGNMDCGEVLIVMGAGDIYKLADYFPLDRN